MSEESSDAGYILWQNGECLDVKDGSSYKGLYSSLFCEGLIRDADRAGDFVLQLFTIKPLRHNTPPPTQLFFFVCLNPSHVIENTNKEFPGSLLSEIVAAYRRDRVRHIITSLIQNKQEAFWLKKAKIVGRRVSEIVVTNRNTDKKKSHLLFVTRPIDLKGVQLPVSFSEILSK